MIDIHLDLGNHNVLLETNYNLWAWINFFGPIANIKWTYMIAHDKDLSFVWISRNHLEIKKNDLAINKDDRVHALC